jgi:NAD(P) transhydrogenase subunit alpha
MIAGVLKEPSFENRISLLPKSIAALIKKGVSVFVEPGSGANVFCSDEDFLKSGATIRNRDEILAEADIILGIQAENIPASLQNKIIVGVYQPFYHAALMAEWASRGITSFSLDMLPRTTRAQSMDVLSSQANIAGYKAVLLAANTFSHYFPMLMTAAGSIPPAKLLILGAGVAGLQAIATGRRLGAVVEVFDTRPAVKEEVMSLGAKFVEVEGAADASKAGGYAVEQNADFLERQKLKIAESIAKADIVISTAQIPGKKAPILVTTAMIEAMKKGSVIIDLASATGGNTEQTKDNETVVYHGVTIIGNSALASTMPYDASRLYGKNLVNFLQLITGKDGAAELNFQDELVSGCCITHNGQVVKNLVR